MNAIYVDAVKTLKRHSVNYVDPIFAMPPVLHQTMLAVYLLMRGVDEVEDHPSLGAATKASLLYGISDVFQAKPSQYAFSALFARCPSAPLTEVSLRLGDWILLMPKDIAPRVVDQFASMAERMARWVEADFRLFSEEDLDRYTHAAATGMALLLGDIWAWYDGTKTDRTLLLGYARGVQTANIIKDRSEDQVRGVSFWPVGWDLQDMRAYAERNLRLADRLMETFSPDSPAYRWCRHPMDVAWKTVQEVSPVDIGAYHVEARS